MTIQLTFNSVNITLKTGENGLRVRHVQEGSLDFSGSGKYRAVPRYGIMEGRFSAYFQDAVYYDLWAWWSWARQGKTWAFAMDSGDVLNTTLDGAAAAAQKTIPVASTTGLEAGDKCLIRAEDADDEFEVVEIDTIDDGVSVDVVENLIFSYDSDDVFRHFEYFPSVLSLDTFFDPVKSGDEWSMEFKFIEAL